jgi:hypothetical protein
MPEPRPASHVPDDTFILIRPTFDTPELQVVLP